MLAPARDVGLEIERSAPRAAHSTVASPARLIAVATGPSARTKRVTEQHKFAFGQLVEFLQPVRVSDEKDGPWIALVKLKPGTRTRKAANVESVSGWVGDFDDGQLRAEQILERMAGYASILVSTHSHTPEHPKFRLFVPYARPVTPAEHSRLFDHFASLFDGHVDTSGRDPFHLFYTPSCPAVQLAHRVFHV